MEGVTSNGGRLILEPILFHAARLIFARLVWGILTSFMSVRTILLNLASFKITYQNFA